MRYFLIDRVTEIVPGKRIEGVKAVSLSEDVLHDHFPGLPVLPGLLILEGAAQLSGFLLEATVNRKGEAVRRAVLAQVKTAKFHSPVGPGELVRFSAEVSSLLEGAGLVRVRADVEDRRVATAELTFILKAIEEPEVHEQRRALYRLWTRGLEPRPEIP